MAGFPQSDPVWCTTQKCNFFMLPFDMLKEEKTSRQVENPTIVSCFLSLGTPIQFLHFAFIWEEKYVFYASGIQTF